MYRILTQSEFRSSHSNFILLLVSHLTLSYLTFWIEGELCYEEYTFPDMTIWNPAVEISYWSLHFFFPKFTCITPCVKRPIRFSFERWLYLKCTVFKVTRKVFWKFYSARNKIEKTLKNENTDFILLHLLKYGAANGWQRKEPNPVCSVCICNICPVYKNATKSAS